MLIAFAPVAAYLALQLPSIQSWAAKRAASVLSRNLDTEVSVEKVYYVFFNKLILKNVHILSSPSDTLLNVEKISLTLSGIHPFAHRISLKKALLQGGVFHLEIEQKQTNIERVFNIQRGGAKERDTTTSPWLITLKDFALRDFRFTLKNEARSRQGSFPETMDFSDLDVYQINLNVQKVRLQGDTLFCSLKGLSAKEKSGYILNKVSGEVAVSGTGARIRELIIQDPYSDIRADGFYMHYDHSRDFKYFTDSVRLEADFKNALLSFRSLSYYAPAIDHDNNLTAYITGHVDGPVRYLKSQGLHLCSTSGITQIEADFRIKGLPTASITTAFLDISRLNSSVGDIAQILSQLNGTNPLQISRYISPLIPVKFQGQMAGLLTDFAVNGDMTTGLGNLRVDAVMAQERGRGFHINGSIAAQEFQLGSIAGKPFGALTMHTHARALIRNSRRGGLEADMDSLRINKIEVNGYPFSNILAIGNYKQQRFDGRVVCSDPNLSFIFQGLANLNYKEIQSGQASRYDFFANIAYADLAAIGLDSRDSISRISGSIRANFQQSITGDLVGNITVNEADYTNHSGVYALGPISVNSRIQDSLYRFELSAPFAEANYTGSQGLLTFVRDLRRTALSRYLPNYFPPEEVPHQNQDYHLDIIVRDMQAIGQLALPGLYIAPQTRLTATLTPDDSLHCLLRSQYIRYNEQRANNIALKFAGDSSFLHTTLSTNELSLLGQIIDTMNVRLTAHQNQIGTVLEYQNFTGQNKGGTLSADINFLAQQEKETPNIAIHVQPSSFIINNSKWDLDSSLVLLADQSVQFRQVNLHNQAQSLTVNGALSKTRADTLHLAMDRFDISLVNIFLENSPYRVAGTFTGDAQILDFYNNRQFSMDLRGEDVFVNNMEAGALTLMCKWNHETQRFQIGAQNVLQGKAPMKIAGFYRPDNKYLNLSASLQNFPVSYFGPFLSFMVSDLNGDVSGELNLSGTLPDLSLTSPRVQANNVAFTVDFTKVPYTLNGPIVLNANGFTVQNGVITDQNGNKGTVNGGMKYKFFRDITLDAVLDFNNLLCLATKEKDNSAFYGDVFATGRLHASGNLTQVLLDIFAKTEKNSALHIPLSNLSEAKQSSLLSFVAPPDNTPPKLVLDPWDMRKKTTKTKEPTKVAVQLKTEVTPDAELLIEINKATGDVISGFGSGNIAITVDPAKSLFDIFGDYAIANGDYLFVLQGILSKKFTINPGGQITFNGDILKTNLDLTAAYHTKASISPLLSDNNAVANLRDVECQIHMTGHMMNPNLGFDIEVSDLDPSTRARVEAALSPEDKLIRQFMALLVTGSFMPDQRSGVVNNSSTAILYSNATEILSNQLNNIFGQLKIPLDVGFNYQPNDNGRDIYDVAISTQLFNNRVVVNGNVGNTQNSGATGDVAGNIDIEVKITNNGNFRTKVFSHSSDQYSSYSNYYDLDNTQRNGVGILYQEEFNTFRELFNRIFVRKKKRLEREVAKEQAAAALRKQEETETEQLLLPEE